MPLGMEVGLIPGDFVLDGDPAPYIFGPCLLVIVISLEDCPMHIRYVIGLFKFKFNFSILCILFLESLIVISMFRYAQLHHIAPIPEVGVAN